MHAVILLLYIIQVLSIFIDTEVAEDSLHQQERVKVLVVPAWRIVEHAHT
jgi:hypothetical protein